MPHRRAHARRLLQVPATVHLLSQESHTAVHLVDISRTGVAFASTEPLEAGTVFVLSFWLPGDAKACTAEGTAVYSTPLANRPMFRIGARLREMNAETEAQLTDFLTNPHR